MQTSEHRTGSKRIRIIGIIALFVAVFVLLNALLCFLIEPYRPSGYEMWEGFRSKTTLDTVYVGTSEAECGIDPAVVDSATGSSSYNMATNMQDLYCSFDAMRTAVEEKGITRVVLCLDTDISSMERKDNSRAEENYILARARTESASKGLKDRLSFAFSPEIIGTSASLTLWFPWIYNRSFDVKKNVTEKLSGAVSDPLGHRDENGFEPNDVVTENPGFVDREDAESFSTENGTYGQQPPAALRDPHVLQKSRRDSYGDGASCGKCLQHVRLRCLPCLDEGDRRPVRCLWDALLQLQPDRQKRPVRTL